MTSPSDIAPRTTRTSTAQTPEPLLPTGPRQRAAHYAVAANSSHLRFAMAKTTVDISLPPLDKIAFYAGLGGAAAFGILEWPVAVLTGLGHLLSDDRHNRTLRALGEALDAVA